MCFASRPSRHVQHTHDRMHCVDLLCAPSIPHSSLNPNSCCCISNCGFYGPPVLLGDNARAYRRYYYTHGGGTTNTNTPMQQAPHHPRLFSLFTLALPISAPIQQHATPTHTLASLGIRVIVDRREGLPPPRHHHHVLPLDLRCLHRVQKRRRTTADAAAAAAAAE